MTVITAMRINDGSVAMVTDAESETFEGKRDLNSKIWTVSGDPAQALIGGAGSAAPIFTMMKAMQRRIDRRKQLPSTVVDIGNIVSGELDKLQSAARRSYIKEKFKLSERELQLGRRRVGKRIVKIDDGILDTYRKDVRQFPYSDIKPRLNVSLLIAGVDADGATLSRRSDRYWQPLDTVFEFDAIGSGESDARAAIHDRFEQRDRDATITKYQALSDLLYATSRASKHSIGVGGTPKIAVIDEGELFLPGENASLLASEIEKGVVAGELTSGFRRDAFQAMLFEDEPYETVETAMWGEAKDPVRLSRVLRGYKLNPN